MTRPHWVTPEPEEVLGLWKAAARASDPPTSHEAAKRAPVAGHCRLVLEALAAGPAGQTEIARRCGLLPHEVNKRLSDLKRHGLAEPTGRRANGGTEREWRAAHGR
jgi:hypothetical protein